MFLKPQPQEVSTRLSQFLSKTGKNIEDIDLVLFGINGEQRYDKVYHTFAEQVFPHTPSGYYKHLCGEYFTSSAFGLWLAAKILYHQQMPEVVSFQNKHTGAFRNIIIYNHFRNTEHSFILVTQT